jgi:hypothetical protein
MSIKKFQSVILVFVLFSGAPGIADELKETLVKKKVSVDLRYRFELVNQEGIENDAKASTLRLRLGYTTEEFSGFTIRVDLEAIKTIGFDDYNSTDNDKLDYPVVADPEDSELNQAFIIYSGIKDTFFTFGRQRIKLDNDRFIGNVGWRQNEQTYDAFMCVNTSIRNSTITFAHILNVNRIFGGHHSSLSDLDVSANIIHLNYVFSSGQISAYGHFIENQDVPVNSHYNLGLRLSGTDRLSGSAKLLYTLEYAVQNDYKEGADFIDVPYRFLELGSKWDNFTIKAGYEELGSNALYSFSTPFATLHAFNGWADKFLSTPVEGLIDKYIFLSYQTKLGEMKVALKAYYHDFQSSNNRVDYGTELDLQAQLILSKECNLIVKYASYNAQEYATDTQKFWAGIQFSF